MPTDTNTVDAAPAAAQTTEAPSFTQETPSSTVDSLPQNEGDFATWLSDRLEKFEKGEEVAPWEQKADEDPTLEKQEEAETEDAAEGEKEVEETAEPEKQDDTDDEETKNMSASAGAKFKELKSELKEYKSKVSALEKAVEEARTSQKNPEEVEQLRAQLAEYEREIALTRVEATPEFKRAVIEPTQAILDTASSMAERYKIDARKLVNALREESVSEGSDALTELAADFSERDRVRLYRMADDLADVSRRRDYLRENAAKAYEEHQESARAEEERMEAEYRKRVSAEATRVWEDTLAKNPTFASLDKAALEEIHKAGLETDLLEADVDLRAYASYAGLALPHVLESLSNYAQKVSELEKALGKYKKATPKVSGNADTSPAPNVDDGGFLDAIEKRFSLG